MMLHKTRKITEEQYFRAIANRGYLTKEDFRLVFTDSERLGYGAQAGSVFISDENGLPYVNYSISTSCD